MKLFRNIQDLNTAWLLMAYVGLFAIYVLVPINFAHKLISPLMLGLMGVVLVNTLKYL